MSTNNKKGFSECRVHDLVFKDEFCEFALDVRNELLNFPDWVEMRQDGEYGRNVIRPKRQNGLTTGHIIGSHRNYLPNCLRFKDYLKNNLKDLCDVMDVQFSNDLQIEINAMAYGEGAWLSSHTDCGATATVNDRRIAWMLYLTSPDAGEWPIDKGGAVRLWQRDGGEARLRPKFNRFAMFKVHKGSFHEIEKISSPTDWKGCRLALSGWVRGACERVEKNMGVYIKSADFQSLRDEVSASLQGSIALYALMVHQRTHCGVTNGNAAELLDGYKRDYEAHLKAPDGTSFSHRAPGPPGCVTVLDDKGSIYHFGRMDDYSGAVSE